MTNTEALFPNRFFEQVGDTRWLKKSDYPEALDDIYQRKDEVLNPQEWVLPSLSGWTKTGADSFTVTGDHRDIFYVGRQLKITMTGPLAVFYEKISTSTYSSGTGLTTVTLQSSIMTSTTLTYAECLRDSVFYVMDATDYGDHSFSDYSLNEMLSAVGGDNREVILAPGNWLIDSEAFPEWQAGHTYVYGDKVRPTDGNKNTYWYMCTVGGVSDASEPVWGTTEGGTTSDNTVTWTCYMGATFPSTMSISTRFGAKLKVAGYSKVLINGPFNPAIWETFAKYEHTTIKVQASAGATDIDVNSIYGLADDMELWITLDDGTLHHTTIDIIVDADTIRIIDEIPAGRYAAVAAIVYTWGTVQFGQNSVKSVLMELWGGKGDSDGTTGNGVDNLIAFSRALKSLPATGGVVEMLDGYYRFTDYLDMAPTGVLYTTAVSVSLIGKGKQNTVIYMDNDSPTVVSETIGDISTVIYNGYSRRMILRDFAVAHTMTYTPRYSWHPAYAIYNEGGNSIFDNLELIGFDYGLYLYGANTNTVKKVRCPYCRHGITIREYCFGSRVVDCDVESAGDANAGKYYAGWGIKIQNTGSLVVENLVESIGPNWIINSSGIEIIGGNYENNRSGACWHISGTQIQVAGNELSITAGNKFYRLSGSWIDDGVEVGDKLLSWGWNTSGNNTANVSPYYFTVTNVDVLELTVSDSLTIEAAHTDGYPSVTIFSGLRLASSLNWSRGIKFLGGRYWDSYGFLILDGSGWIDIDNLSFYNFYPTTPAGYLAPTGLGVSFLLSNKDYARKINWHNTRWHDNVEPTYYGTAGYGHIAIKDNRAKLAAIPSTGTYDVGEVILNSVNPAFYWECLTAGTFGSLNGGATTATVATATSAYLAVLDSMVGIFPGAWVTLYGAGAAGADLNVKIGDVDYDTMTIAFYPAASTDVTGARIDYVAPVLKLCGEDNTIQAKIYAPAITPTLELGGVIRIGQLTGDLALNTPTGYVAGQKFKVLIYGHATDVCNVTLASTYSPPNEVIPILPAKGYVLEFVVDPSVTGTALVNQVPKRQIYKVTKTYTDFSVADTVSDLTIFTLPAKTRLCGIISDTTTEYSGGGVTAATLKIGKGSGGSEYMDSHNVFAAAVVKGLADADLGTDICRSAAVQGGDLPSWTVDTDVVARLTTTTKDVDQLTQGSTTFYLTIESLI